MNKTKVHKIHNISKDLFWIGVVLIAVLLCAYVYFLSLSMLNIKSRQSISESRIELNSRVSKLESEYVARQNSISNEIIKAKNLVFVNPSSYINKSTGLSLAKITPTSGR